jgi:cobaltochelatase CobN
MKRSTIILVLLLPIAASAADGAGDEAVSFAVIGMSDGAVEAMRADRNELGYSVEHMRTDRFVQDPLPDLSVFDAVITSFTSSHLEERYREAVAAAREQNPDLHLFCVGPRAICDTWGEWVGQENIVFDPQMAAYYGLSEKAMADMVRYTLITYFGREGQVDPPGTGEIPRIHHPGWGTLETIDGFLARARAEGWDTDEVPRVALGTWRHHLLFHQPEVVEALIADLEERGMLAVCLVADDPEFTRRLRDLAPDLVIMTSHTREPPEFWEELDVPRLHALWFTEESIEKWRTSNQPGMKKSSMFHQIVSSELKGATECLTAGGTMGGHGSGEEIVPIPDRIARIAGRARAWIDLARKDPAEREIAVVIYDREADKAGLMSGPAHNLNAPRSLLELLDAMDAAGYSLEDVPAVEDELIARVADHGRQMGSWEPGPLDALARSGHAVLVPEERYRTWFRKHVPERRRQEVVEAWGPVPGDVMVWEKEGVRYLVLPRVELGKVTLVTQPVKGETITATTEVQSPDESLLPPTHHFLATYFWMQHGLRADAVVHFGTHGQEWLFAGKQAVLSGADWSDILIGDVPNVNPWLASNTAELLPCKRRARAVTVGFLPPPLIRAGLPDDLLNLESAIEKYDALEPGALRKGFAETVTEQAVACGLDRELDIAVEEGELLDGEEIARVSRYLHDLGNEHVPASMHVLGVPPEDELLIPYLVHCMGSRYLDASRKLFGGAKASPETLRDKGADVLGVMVRQELPAADAVRACGGRTPGGKLPDAVRESLETAAGMYEGFQRTPQEIDGILQALDGRFVPPGPSGTPERNPGVVPTGRNLFLMNPQELPSRASWELGSRLIRDYLEDELSDKGRYPQKIAFSLVPFATYSDYGIIESQILYLLGVRPVWDAKNRVRDVELVPRAELGRPRIDVFISIRSIYRDELPSLARLIDEAIRLAAAQDEPDNNVRLNSEATRVELEAEGVPADTARVLSTARMFGAEPDEIVDSHNWFFYLTERSGEWETEEDLLEVYLAHTKHVYTEGMWGENAPEAFDSTIQGTELILRSWYDNRDFVLSNKFAWWVDGSLSLAVKHMTGEEPDYLFVDVRDPDEASIVDSADVVQMDFRARLTNPRWIRGMMAEGYAGGNVIARDVNNLMGWEIMREHAVEDGNWERLVDLYVHDTEDLGTRRWFDAENPHAFQKMTVTMMETIRKGYWDADAETRLAVARAYAESVAAHGRASGAREGGNEKLAAFVSETLAAADTAETDALLEAYRRRSAELRAPGEPVEGRRLSRKRRDEPGGPAVVTPWTLLVVAGLAVLLVAGGFFGRDLRRRMKRRRRP